MRGELFQVRRERIIAASGGREKLVRHQTQVVADSTAQSKWTFTLDQVSLANVRFSYNDEYAGMNVSAALQNSEFSIDGIDFQKSVYRIDELLLDGLRVHVLVTESANSSKNQSGSVSPKVSAKNLELKNSTINYTD